MRYFGSSFGLGRGEGGARTFSFSILVGGGHAGGWGSGVGAGAWGRGCAGAITRCDRSLIADWRTERSWWGGGVWGSQRFAICEERSRSSSCNTSFSLARDVSFWVILESFCEMVTSPVTSWERRVGVAVSDRISLTGCPARSQGSCGSNKGRIWLRRVVLPCRFWGSQRLV